MEVINCPICQSSALKNILEIEDYTVSRETFQLVECENCQFKFTNPRPKSAELNAYYESQAYVSHSDTDEGLINKLYKLVRKISLKRKLSLMNSFIAPDKTILDIGCGTGAFLNNMKENHWFATGVEPNDLARLKAVNGFGLTVHKEDFLKEGMTLFNVITLWHVLEHVHGLTQRLDEIKQHMNSATTLVIAVPNCESSDANHYKEFWAAYDVPRHLYHFTPKTMSRLMHDHGLQIVQKEAMPFDAFYVSMLSEKYKSQKANFLSAIYQGIVSNLRSLNNVDKCSSIIYIVKLKD